MAKDMGVKSKDISDILASHGIEVKTTQSSLSPEQFGVLFEALTSTHQITHIEDYIDGITYIPSKKKPVEAAEPKKEEAVRDTPAAEAPKKETQSEPVKQVKAEPKKETQPEPAKEVKPEPAKEAKPEPKKEIAQEPVKAAQPEVKAESRPEPRKESAKSEPRQAERQAQSQTAQQSQKPAQPQQAQRPAQSQQTQRPNQGQQTQRPPYAQSQQAQGQRRDTRDGAPQGARQGGYGQQAPAGRQGGYQGGYQGGQSQRPAPAQSQAPRKDARRDGGRFDDRDNPQSAPKEKFQPQAIVRGQTPKGTDSSKTKTGTRVVDTRGTTVDLSKYDEKLDSYVPEVVREDRGGTQKVKSKGTQAKKGGEQIPSPKFGADRQKGGKGKKKGAPAPVVRQPLNITIPDEITVGELASRLKATAGDVIKKLMLMGQMVMVNQSIDYDTAALVAMEFDANVTREVVVTIEERLFDSTEDSDDNLVERAPVVCVMGHVDHGKTSLLDAIRNTHVTRGEAGGITQHIGAYRVNINDKDITFLDTPGHEAFTAMRARGAQATDIAILVVAADDGIMPQTVEAINHAKAAGVDIIVAINKIDKPTAKPDQVKQELVKYNLVPEEWGGDIICVPVSALTGEGIDELLENVLVLAEVKELKANPNRHAKGIVIEAKLDRGRGPVATILVQNGTLRSGDVVIAGTAVGRVRAMTDHTGRTVKIATPSVPVEITGLSEVPTAGDEFNAVADEKMARELAEQRKSKAKEEVFKANARANLDDLFAQISDGIKELCVIVKADVVGSAEAVKASLLKISNEEVKVNVIHTAVGGITENDVMLAATSNAIIVGFNVRPDRSALDSAERQGVDIRTYRIIYECIEEITAAMKGMLAPKYKEVIIGHAEVRQTIHVPGVGTIAGSYVQNGKVTRSSLVRVLRDSVVIFEDKISSLRRFKDDVKEVGQSFECGIGLEKFNDMKVGDILELYIMEEIER